MLKFSVLFFLIFVVIVNSASGQIKFREKGTLEIKISGGNSEGSSFFDKKGNDMPAVNDPNIDENLSDRNYRFRYNATSFGIGAEYAFTDNFALYGSIPLSYTRLKEKGDTAVLYEDYNGDMRLDTTTFTRGDHSLFRPDFFSVGIKYMFFDQSQKKSHTYGMVSAECRLPAGMHDGILNDPDYDFLSDGAVEMLVGGAIGIKFKKVFLESGLLYNYRAEDLVDQIIIHSVFGLSTVESTSLTGFLDIIQSTESMDNVVLFDPRHTNLQEEIIGMGIAVNLLMKDKYDFNVGYRLVLSGKNNAKYGGFFVNLGLLIH